MTEFIHVKRSSVGKLKPLIMEKRRPQSQSKQDAANGKFNFDQIHGFKLIDVEYKVPPKREREARRSQFKGIRADFLREVGRTHEKELRAIGMNDSMIAMVKSGRTPKGYNVHHKLPIHGGGKNEFSNFILMPIPPHDDLHHKVLDPQVCRMQEGDRKTVKLPWSDNMVYVPPERKNMRNLAMDKKLQAMRGR